MTIETYCIGTPGQTPRMFITTDDATAKMQLKPGEVYFYQSSYVPAPHMINAAGNAVVATTLPLATVQQNAWIAAKQFRQSKLMGGITTPKGVVQSDTKSCNFIGWAADDATRFKLANQVSLLGLFKFTTGTWTLNFRMMDNTVVSHNGDDMIAMAASVKAFDVNCQAASDAIRTAIFGATTNAAVTAIDVTAGYPS